MRCAESYACAAAEPKAYIGSKVVDETRTSRFGTVIPLQKIGAMPIIKLGRPAQLIETGGRPLMTKPALSKQSNSSHRDRARAGSPSTR